MLLYVFSLLTILVSYYEIGKKKKKIGKKVCSVKKKKKIGKNCWSAKNISHLAKI